MDVENGCLKIVPSSHKLGMVEHEDIVWNNMVHKQRAKHSEMKELTKYGIMNVEMELVIFWCLIIDYYMVLQVI